MNLYNLHKDPKSLHKHKEAHDFVPDLLRNTEEYKKGNLNPKQLETVLNDPYLAYNYMLRHGRNQPWPEAEDGLAKDAETANLYAEFYIRGRFPKGEKTIAKDRWIAIDYAQNVLKGRFPAAEKAISGDPKSAYEYAVKIIKDKWPPGEYAMSHVDDDYDEAYNEFLKSKGYGEEDLI